MLPENTSSSESNGAAPPGDGRPTRVLLAEDDRALRRFLEVVLQRAGYKVIPAADGPRIVVTFQRNEFNALTDDINSSGTIFCINDSNEGRCKATSPA